MAPQKIKILTLFLHNCTTRTTLSFGLMEIQIILVKSLKNSKRFRLHLENQVCTFLAIHMGTQEVKVETTST